jgi:hypothetical protein
MLLLAQTISSKVERLQLSLNGDLVRLGVLDDVISQADGDNAITIAFKIRTDPRLLGSAKALQRSYFPWYAGPTSNAGTVSGEIRFGKAEPNPDGRASRHAELISGNFDRISDPGDVSETSGGKPAVGGFTIRRQTNANVEAVRGKGTPEAVTPEALKSALKYSFSSGTPVTADHFPFRTRDMIPGRRLDVVGVSLEHFLPQYLVIRKPTAESMTVASVAEYLTSNSKENLLGAWRKGEDPVKAALADLLTIQAADDKTSRPAQRSVRSDPLTSELIDSVLQRVAGSSLSGQVTFSILPPTALMSVISAALAIEFSFLRYLGPLRADPRPLYDIGTGSDPRDVGTKGEFTAAVLDLFGEEQVDFIPPNSLDDKPHKTSLRSAVHAWLRHFEIARTVEVTEEGKLGHRLHILPDGLSTQVDLTNVGVGASQVLPILVMALISEPGSVLLFEQPELHLHPRVQSQLADFFLSIINTGRQCIVETHSEYLVNRLRRRVAESEWDSSTGDSVLLYFVERDGLQSTFSKIDINPYGAIPNWPRGFFDQGPSESDSIMAAAHRKRAKKPGP